MPYLQLYGLYEQPAAESIQTVLYHGEEALMAGLVFE